MNYPKFDSYWKQTGIDFIKKQGVTMRQIPGIEEDLEFREGIGEEEYIKDCLWGYLPKLGLENYLIDKVNEWVLAHNSPEEIEASGWGDYDYMLNELVYSEADVTGLLDDIICSLTLEEITSLLGN